MRTATLTRQLGSPPLGLQVTLGLRLLALIGVEQPGDDVAPGLVTMAACLCDVTARTAALWLVGWLVWLGG